MTRAVSGPEQQESQIAFRVKYPIICSRCHLLTFASFEFLTLGVASRASVCNRRSLSIDRQTYFPVFFPLSLSCFDRTAALQVRLAVFMSLCESKVCVGTCNGKESNSRVSPIGTRSYSPLSAVSAVVAQQSGSIGVGIHTFFSQTTLVSVPLFPRDYDPRSCRQ